MFLVLGLFFGLLFLLVTPPFQVPDEPAHFYRAYQVSRGGLVPQQLGTQVGGNLPRSLSKLEGRFKYLQFHSERRVTAAQVLDARRIPLGPNDEVFTSFPNAALYSPVNYLPQAIGIAIARSLELPHSTLSTLPDWPLCLLGLPSCIWPYASSQRASGRFLRWPSRP